MGRENESLFIAPEIGHTENSPSWPDFHFPCGLTTPEIQKVHSKKPLDSEQPGQKQTQLLGLDCDQELPEMVNKPWGWQSRTEN